MIPGSAGDRAEDAIAGAGTARIGIDLGGTKIEGVRLEADGTISRRQRLATPRGDYDATLQAIAALVAAMEGPELRLPVGIGIPGSPNPHSGLIRNANSTWLNGRALGADLAARLDRPVRLANDADCLAVSEAADGAAHGAATVFGVILGTGVGGGLVVHGQPWPGANGVSGEWGHLPLPWAGHGDWQGAADEHPGPACWCGRRGCLEAWLSGPALAADHVRVAGHADGGRADGGRADCGRADSGHADGGHGDQPQGLRAEAIVAAAAAGDRAAQATLARHQHRLARGLAMVVTVLDPQVIVLGGGVSLIPGLADAVAQAIAPWCFGDRVTVRVVQARHGDSSGVRGAAWLWPPGTRVERPDPGRRG